MSLKFPPVLSLEKYFGKSTLLKGADYARKNKVQSVVVKTDHQGKQFLDAKVMGSSRKIYTTHVYIENANIVSAQCSCPVGYNCKHSVAAVMMASKSSDLQEETSQPVPLWKKNLKNIFTLVDANEKKYDQQLVILIDIEETKNQKKSKKNILFRPALHNTITGKTLVGDISWAGRTNARLSEEQQIYFSMFCSFIASKVSLYYYTYSLWASLEYASVIEIWKLIQRRNEYGVKFQNKKYQDIEIGEEVMVGVLLEEQKKQVTLSLQVTKNGETLDPQTVFLLGDKNIVFAVIQTDTSFSLHPVQSNVPVDALPILSQKITIPNEKLEELQRDWIPQISKKLTLNNTTSKIKVPKYISPTPVLSVVPSGKGITTTIQYKYGDMVIPEEYTEESLTQNGEIIMRNKEEENALKLSLQSKNVISDISLQGVSAARFINETIPFLKDQGIETIQSDNLPVFSKSEEVPEVSFVMEEADGDWFNLNIQVAIGEEKIPFSEVFSAISKGEQYLLLDNGVYFSLEHDSFAQLRKLVEESKKMNLSTKEGLSLSVFQTGFWNELKALGIVEKQATRWEQLVKNLSEITEIPKVKPSKKLQATLRPYQEEGVSWMNFLLENQLGGVLADDMGLGKTLQTIATIVNSKSKKPFLVIAPTSVVENWDREIQKFAPSLTTVVLRKGKRDAFHKQMKQSNIVITSYSLLRRDFDVMDEVEWAGVFLDEAQFVKNFQSHYYADVKKLKADSKIALTGTPMENNLMELWSIFSLVAPGLFPSPDYFKELYQRPIEKENSKEMLQKLRTRIKPFILRRKKEMVAKELPPKTEQILDIELSAKHRHLYDVILQQERKKVLNLLDEGGMKQNRFKILQSLTMMRQLCLHPGLVDEKYADLMGTKLEILEEQLEEILAEGHKVLIFSQFTEFLGEVKNCIKKRNWDFLYLDGKTKDRGELIDDFQSENGASVFLISLKAGGFGLTLTNADYCILLDPWWNPAAESQAVDRTHRIGQTKNVMVYRFIAKDTIEEKVVKLQERKKKLFSNVLEEGDVFASLVTDDEIREIFS